MWPPRWAVRRGLYDTGGQWAGGLVNGGEDAGRWSDGLALEQARVYCKILDGAAGGIAAAASDAEQTKSGSQL